MKPTKQKSYPRTGFEINVQTPLYKIMLMMVMLIVMVVMVMLMVMVVIKMLTIRTEANQGSTTTVTQRLDWKSMLKNNKT